MLALLGPTASGKSAAAMALAGRFPVEIISVDSVQVYRGMDIGTAKPGRDERARVAHHLIDVIDPTEAFSAARFAAEAARLIGEIAGRGHVPLLAGGTMLYFKALREGLSRLPEADPAVRAALEAEAAAAGWPALHRELARVDPATAARLQPNDAQRVQRALEVFRVSGRPLSALLAAGTAADTGAAAPAGMFGRDAVGSAPATEDWLVMALLPGERARLHERIAVRFDAMLEGGLVEELAALRTRYALDPAMPSMRAVGYRQAWEFLDGRMSRDALRDRGVYATRQLAKRQLTWLRSTRGLTCIEALDARAPERVIDTAASYLAARGAAG